MYVNKEEEEEEEEEEEYSLVSHLKQTSITKRLAKNRQEGGSCVEGTHPEHDILELAWMLPTNFLCFAVDCRTWSTVIITCSWFNAVATAHDHVMVSCTVANFVGEEGMTGKLPIVLRCGTSVPEALYPRETSCKYTNVVTGVLKYFERKKH